METENLPLEVTALWDGTALPESEKTALNHVAGYCVHSVTARQDPCAQCKDATLVNGELRAYRPGSLIQVSSDVFQMFNTLEVTFRGLLGSIFCGKTTRTEVIAACRQAVKHIKLPDCHDIKFRLISKYINARFHFYCKMKNEELKKKR
ncbi:hypothetical protein CAPTEDRAFT_212466 [Capitella teleta]|uniref:Uncharacterized protein n=1 Tax=Capitella teleta TaxID=283909 RepID=R7TYN4_CAPTE|nr:hypothetical protein CAPTEDRAFT_212466 [Capitella teleta]|eukprot:ELT99033.1 hypothetical protein CAPTEDRAFT_212466 [Capitella teleta]